jgi:hypothetical protein
MTMTSETLRWPFVNTSTRERQETGEAGTKARLARIPVTDVKHVVLSDLSPAERAKIIDDTYAISVAYFPDNTRDGFERAFFSGDRTWVFLYHGADGALCGFAALSLVRVSHEGKEHAVFKGTIVVDTRYKLVPEARLPILIEALRWKLSNPRTPVAYVGLCSSPSVYRLLAGSVPCIYPSRRAETPATIQALLLKAVRMRGCSVVDEDKLLVRATSRPAYPDRIRASRSLQDDPDARFYLEQNPRFEDLYMAVWLPLDLRNVTAAVVKTLGRHLFGGEPG